jgi:hypothetical protein
MGEEMNAPPNPNRQPDWVNDLLEMYDIPRNADSSGQPVDLNREDIRAFGNSIGINPSFFEVSLVTNPAPDAQFIRVIPPNPDGVMICQKHGTTLRETVSFNVNGHVDVFCMACIVDLIKERLLPINQSTPTDSTSSQEPVQRYSRYDLIKGKDATNV